MFRATNIADLIRQCLRAHPEGVYTDQVLDYCLRHGATFRVFRRALQQKSVSGQLSIMRIRGEVTYIRQGNRYLWRLR